MRNAHSLTWNISKKTKYKTLKNGASALMPRITKDRKSN